MRLVKQKSCVDAWLMACVFLVLTVGWTSKVLLSSPTSADDVVDVVNLTLAVSCSVSETVDTAHTTTLNNDQYKTNIGTTTFNVFCNDKDGYSIYAIGYSGDTYGNTEMLYMGNQTPAPSNIVTGTATSGSTSNWAMKLTAVAGTYQATLTNGFGSYRTVPTTYTKAATLTSQTDTTTGSSIQSTYAVFASATQGAGTYQGKVRYTLVHPNTETPLQPVACVAGKICYNANGSNVEGTMGQQTASDSTETMLLASNFSREGYGFAGWSTTFDYSGSTGFYGPQETIITPADTSTNGLPLYAIWVKSVGNLQNWSGCSSLNSGAVTALTDQRDGETYAVAKLADGNCWMIENLRLESADTVGNNRFDSSITNQSLAQGYGTSATYGNFGGLASAESSNFSDSTNANSLYYSGTQSGDATIDIGTTNYPGRRMPRYNNLNTSTRASNPTNNNGNRYSYGNYYTWHAAIADLTYNGTINQSTTGTSLCPAGWHLPKGGSKSNEANNELWSLVVDGINGGIKPANYDNETRPYYADTPEGSDASNKLRAYPNNFLYSGYFWTSSAGSRGSSGGYWSSTAISNVNSYNLYLSSSYIDPGTSNNTKYDGRSIRCTVGS